MNKLMTVVAASVCAVSLSVPAFAEEKSTEKPSAGEAEAEVAEEEESALFEAGFDFDYFSAFVWRNAVQNDRMVMQPCVWADLTALDPFWFGFSIWQNYDLTNRRRSIYRYALNEVDYNVHAGVTAWESDDEDYSLGFEIGHEWYTYPGVRDYCGEDWLPGAYPNTRELYAKVTFANPFVNVYGQISWMYEDFGDYQSGLHYELGLNKEVELCDSLSVGADWNLSFADGRYLNFLYGGIANPKTELEWNDEDGVWEPTDSVEYDRRPNGGIAGTTVKCYLSWAITDWLSLRGTVAYTGLLNDSLRDAIGEQGGDYEFCYNPGAKYPRDQFWGGLSLNLEF